MGGGGGGGEGMGGGVKWDFSKSFFFCTDLLYKYINAPPPTKKREGGGEVRGRGLHTPLPTPLQPYEGPHVACQF